MILYSYDLSNALRRCYMTTNKELETQVKDLTSRVSTLANANSQLTDEVYLLKNNYNNLVVDVNKRLEVVHNKIFREKTKTK